MYINADGSVLPCCIGEHHRSLGNVQHNKIIDIWNSEKYKNMRRRMLAGERCDECSACYSTEDNGAESFRQSKTVQFSKYLPLANKTLADGSLETMDLKYFDVRWSNICNFKCRSCSSTYSSSWATEDNKNGQDKKVFIFAGGINNDDLYEQFLPHFDGIEEFYFAGGEPLLTDKHYEILEYLISIGKTNVRLRYNTNLSNLVYKNKSVIDLWKQFTNILVFASLDSWKDRAEYIREGTDWSVIEKNIRLIKQKTPHVQLQMSSVISAFNLFTLPEFLDYIFTNNLFDKHKFYPSFYNLINPHHFSANIFNDQLKLELINKLRANTYDSDHLNQEIQNIIKYVENSVYDAKLLEEFKQENTKFDLIRNRTFATTFPELSLL
jgi:hypothetical protein